MSALRPAPSWTDWVPGLALARVGRRGWGYACLVLFGSLVALACWRGDRVIEAVEAITASGYVEGRTLTPDAALDVIIAALVLVATAALSFAGPLFASRAIDRPAETPLRPVSRIRSRVLANRQVRAGGVLLLLLYLVALLAPLLSPYDPILIGDLDTARLLPPSFEHPLGTDRFARDVFSRLLWGSRVSLSVGLLAVAISVTLGVLVGAFAGYAGGFIDGLVMRILDALLCFPTILLVIACVGFLEDRSIWLVVTVIGLLSWMDVARLMRGQLLSLVQRDWFLAARGLGASAPRIIFRHLLPNALTPILVVSTLRVGNVILLEASLGFLGLGITPPTPTWGGMIHESRGQIFSEWWIPFAAGLAVVITVTAWHLLGDGLRDALDPRIGREEASPQAIAPARRATA